MVFSPATLVDVRVKPLLTEQDYIKEEDIFLFVLLFGGHTKSAANSLSTHSDSELPTSQIMDVVLSGRLRW